MEIPVKHKKWLNDRGISDDVLFKNNISVLNGQIVIPVYDPAGHFLFNKYRRDPFNDEGPKYRYDKGAKAALYNAHAQFFPSDPVFICEGELDAMALQSKGFFAVSTTGGSGTFEPEWVSLLEGHPIYICYDNDVPGMLGTIKLLKMFPDARVVLIPAPNGMKDVTDFLKRYPDRWVEICSEAEQWNLPKTKEECKIAASLFTERHQNMLRSGLDSDFANAALSAVTDIYDSLRAGERKKKAPRAVDGDALERAHQVPIGEYVTFNKKGGALCIAHDDKHPSMHWFRKNNRVKCFACGFNGDVIDVVMKLFSLKTGEAIKKINGI